MNAKNQTAIAIVGIGEIARNQHVPSIERNPSFALAAAVSRNNVIDSVENFTSIEKLVEERPDVSAVALCTPPQVRFQAAWHALSARKHVLLEKPPGATVSEIETLIRLAEKNGVVLFATWHSRFAPAVEPARTWLADCVIKGVKIDWREDVRKWHPGQEWIWQAGGMGVFDPGINALSIATHIIPHDFHVSEAHLEFPENCETPIAATIGFADRLGTDISAHFDWRQRGDEVWNIEVETDKGHLLLSGGGSVLHIDGELTHEAPEAEYDGIYARFAELLTSHQSDVDLAPSKHVADVFTVARRSIVAPFHT
ncbi:MAG: Gfo/Idh/MocA family oxidoreductase [Pseudomonadota bacterium]